VSSRRPNRFNTSRSSPLARARAAAVLNESGEVFRTYSTFARGIENLMGAFMWLDLTPKGRHEFDDHHRSRLSEDGLRDARKARHSDDLGAG